MPFTNGNITLAQIWGLLRVLLQNPRFRGAKSENQVCNKVVTRFLIRGLNRFLLLLLLVLVSLLALLVSLLPLLLLVTLLALLLRLVSLLPQRRKECGLHNDGAAPATGPVRCQSGR